LKSWNSFHWKEAKDLRTWKFPQERGKRLRNWKFPLEKGKHFEKLEVSIRTLGKLEVSSGKS